MASKGIAVSHGAYVGNRETSEHAIWRGMIQRCHNPNAKDYPRYGGLGVQVCAVWRESFPAFLEHVGSRPRGMSIDRYPDTTGDYRPGNVRWATASDQEKNKRATKRWLHHGQTKTLGEWASALGISVALASWRWKTWGTLERGRTWELLPKQK
jgi:hypothetical protein